MSLNLYGGDMKITGLVLALLVLLVSFTPVLANSESNTIPVWSGKCAKFEAQSFDSVTSLSNLVIEATGQEASATNSCFAIFLAKRGQMTNLLYIKNGWALINLPVEVFVPWQEDQLIIGGHTEIAALAVVDEDTVVVNGGIENIFQGNTLMDTIDWSTVKGGQYINEVSFKSSRINLVNNERVWTAQCKGIEFNDLGQALACGRGE